LARGNYRVIDGELFSVVPGVPPALCVACATTKADLSTTKRRAKAWKQAARDQRAIAAINLKGWHESAARNTGHYQAQIAAEKALAASQAQSAALAEALGGLIDVINALDLIIHKDGRVWTPVRKRYDEAASALAAYRDGKGTP